MNLTGRERCFHSQCVFLHVGLDQVRSQGCTQIRILGALAGAAVSFLLSPACGRRQEMPLLPGIPGTAGLFFWEPLAVVS